MTEQELKDLCKEWQRTLGLDNWSVKCKYKRGYDMGKLMGSVDYTQSKLQAVVSILEENDYPDSCIEPYDVEATVVHEHLHILLAPFRPDTEDEDNPHHILFEQTIEILARALVGLKRRSV